MNNSNRSRTSQGWLAFTNVGIPFAALLGLTALFLSFQWMVASTQLPVFEFVLSNRLKGKVDIRLDEEQGIEIPQIEGRYLLEIPASGIVHVNSLEPLLAPHQQFVHYEGGATVPAISPDSPERGQFWWDIGETSINGETTRLIFVVASKTNVSQVDVFAFGDQGTDVVR